jgi:ligand-binding SRPBCC domain-containing protein
MGGFNEEGIRDLRAQILRIAPINEVWGLFEHPKDLAGLTPEASKELLKSYQSLSKLNCKVVAIEACSTWQDVIEGLLKNNLDIPFYLGDDLEQLSILLQQELLSQ